MYLHCPECRLTVYRSVAQAASDRCPRCGRQAVWSSPPFARTHELPALAKGRSKDARSIPAR